VTDTPHTLSDIPDDRDPAASRTTKPEPVPEAAAPPDLLPAPQIAAQTARQTEPVLAGETLETSETPDTSSSDVTPVAAAATGAAAAVESSDAALPEPAMIAAPPAVLGFPEGEPQSLHPSHLRTQLIAHWITICVMSFGAFTILSGLTLGGKLHGARLLVVPGLVATAIVIIALWGWRYQHLEHARTSYAISLAGCEIRRGVLWRRIITVPLSRIQHSDVTQGPLQRAFGLATLTLYTAGTEHAKIDLHGLAFETAMAIRQYLFERSDAHER
jgi:uncharacterized protein